MIKRIAFVFLLALPACLMAQQKEFCSGIDMLVQAAPAGFKTVKDSIVKINEKGIVWACKVSVPGVITGRIISVMGLRYEGALFQSRNLAEVQQAYEKYKGFLNGCLLDKGYVLSYGDNFYPGLEAYKKLVYMSTKDDAPTPPPHVSVETDYSKQTGAYTIVLYVWQH
ncbi:MAG: hypothetical protein P4L41_01440 [Flavipsychrobacter sp.]|nr:hypothetical protein [Flavipsychrobacter sp.]